MEKILYLDSKGKHTTDATKAAHGEIKDRKELRGGRFSIASDGIDILYIEREIGLPVIEVKPKKAKKA